MAAAPVATRRIRPALRARWWGVSLALVLVVVLPKAAEEPRRLLQAMGCRRTIIGRGGRSGRSVLRLRGGGGDGGSTQNENPRAYKELFKKYINFIERPDIEVIGDKLHKCKHCSLTGELLDEKYKICCDDLGNLYNKLPLLIAMSNYTLDPKIHEYTFALHHLLDLKLEKIKRSTNATEFEAVYCCPITFSEMNGRNPFVAIKPSGHVVSKKAVVEQPRMISHLIGRRNWTGKDIVPLVGDDKERDALWERMLDTRADEMFQKVVFDQVQAKERTKQKMEATLSKLKRGRVDSDETNTDDEIKKAEIGTQRQKIMRKHVIGRSNDHWKESLSEQEGEEALNFISKSAAHFSNLDRSVHGYEPADGRADSKVDGKTKHWRRADKTIDFFHPGAY